MSKMSLNSMFTRVARKYDLLNSILTLRLDEAWRENCAKKCASEGVVVDLCCGTGDLTLHVLKHVAADALVVGLDFNKNMLAAAVNKKSAEPGVRNLSFILADAAHLPLRDECIDSVGMAFSLRNLTYRNPKAQTCLREVVRTLRSTGKLACVETSQPTSRLLRILYHLYLMKIVPVVGWLISRRRSAYLYLGASVTDFSSAEEVASILSKAGFHRVSFKHLAFGLVALHVAAK